MSDRKIPLHKPPPTVIIGYRYWELEGDILRSTYTDTAWPVGVHEAMCRRFDLARHVIHDPYDFAMRNRTAPSPVAGCTCGIYLLKAFDEDHELLKYDLIAGVVRGWGKYIEATRGWKVQYAKILALLEPPPDYYPGRRDEYHLQRVGEVYQVPVLNEDQARLYLKEFQ